MAQSAATSRIEELERKFNENPRRYFAPLANEYRKAGNLEQAIAICRTYVPQQPAHMSGQIVFGQALYESGAFDEARTVLEAALTLDPENLIALRHLGDIARARGEVAVARTWYQRVLDADPRNADALSAIAMMPAPTSAATAAAAPAPAPVASVETPAPRVEAVAPVAPAGAAATSPPEAAAIQEPVTELAVEAEAVSEPPASEMAALDAESENQPVVSDEATAPDVAVERPFSSSNEATGSVAEVSPETTPFGEASHDDGELWAAGLHEAELIPDDLPSPVAAPTSYEGAATADPFSSVESGHPEPEAADPAPVEFVTETMAELYLQQGFRQEALEVFQKLLNQNPEDETLLARVQQLEAELMPPEEEVIAPEPVSDAVPAVERLDTTPIVAEAPAGQPSPLDRSSIRSFLSALALRHVGAAGSPVVAFSDVVLPPAAPLSVSDSLDATSIAVTEYEYQHDEMADFGMSASTPSTPFREVAPLDAMFVSDEVTLEDHTAATTLSEGFNEIDASGPVEVAASDPASPAISAVQPASDELSLDRIFGEEEAAEPVAEDRMSFGFDDLFGPGATTLDMSGTSEAATSNDAPPAANGNDLSDGLDAEQFTDWLSGLKKK